MSSLRLSGSTGRLRPLLVFTSITRPLPIIPFKHADTKKLSILLLPRHDKVFQVRPLTELVIELRPLIVM